jgi:UDP-N-acetylglucosamine 4,6-dehydratase
VQNTAHRESLFVSVLMATSDSPLKNKSVLITGGAGFFGRAFVRRCLDEGARRVAIYSRDEVKQASMRAAMDDPRLRFMLGDVRDYARILEACRDVDIVIHAAAAKRIENCEENPVEAVRTNIDGTINVARACIAQGVSRAILTSTDKAASPNTLYGATKLTAERVFNGANVYAAGTPTRTASTRYGNVLASTGSVVPIWKAQRASGEITVTDARCTRFFMSMDDAVNLVVLALTTLRGGEVIVPKLRQASIVSLAQAVAPDCTLREIGLRSGEKLHETLVTEDEARTTYDLGTHYVVEPEFRTWEGIEPLRAPKVPVGFEYRSSTSPAFSIEELRSLTA